MKHELINSFCDWIDPLAKKDGLEFDLHATSQSETQISFQKKELKNYSYSQSLHVNLRVIDGEKAGASYSKDFSKTSIKDCYQKAKDSLQLTDQKTAGNLSENQNYPESSVFYDKSFEDISLESKLEKAKEINSSCLNFDSRVQPVYSSLSDVSAVAFFVNSRRSQSLYSINNIFASCYSLAIGKESRSNGFEFSHSRNYRDIPFGQIGERSAEQAVKKLNYKIPQTKKYPVIFKSGQAVSFLLSRLVDMMNGKSVFEGLSLFKNSLNKALFSKKISLYDDPLALWGANSQPFDGEGFASEKTALVEDTFLKNYLTSSFYAKALKVPHTKKASWTNKGTLDILSTNLIMSEGENSFQDLLNSAPKVVVIDNLKGFAGYNPVSGDFSIESEGFLWEDSELKPLCQFTVSGNIVQLFSNVLKLANDSKIHGGSIKAPSFLTEDLMIAGQ